MPTYEYRCKDCGATLEVVQAFTDDPLRECPDCTGPLRKVFGNVGISFKGNGFYRTDSRAQAKGDGAKGDAPSDGAKEGAPKKDSDGSSSGSSKEPSSSEPSSSKNGGASSETTSTSSSSSSSAEKAKSA